MTISANCQFASAGSRTTRQKVKRNTWLVQRLHIICLWALAELRTCENKGHRYKNRWHDFSLLFCTRLFSIAVSSYCYQIWVTSKNRYEQSSRKIKYKQLFRNEDMQCGCSLCLQIRSDTLITAGFSWNGTARDLESRAYTLILQSSCQCMPCSYDKDYYANNCIYEMYSYL